MRINRQIVLQLPIIFLLTAIPASSEDTAAAKGNAILKTMSEKLASAQVFSFRTIEFHDGVKRNGAKLQIHVTREVLVRRPNGFWTKYAGDRDWEIWYDGKLLTGISAAKKVYIQHEMPPTLDQAIDMLAERLNLDLPMSDVLYSSPYDAFVDAGTKGGLIGKEKIDGSSCHVLIYSSTAVDWQLWVDENTSLPCRLEMTYKKETGKPFYRITFSNWNLSQHLKQEAFAFQIPEGYTRIPILERVLLKRDSSSQTQTIPSQNP